MAGFPNRQRKLSLRAQANLYQNGQVIFHHPYKIFYMLCPALAGTCSEYKIILSAPKRNWKRAVDRNRIKRQMRESFRLHSSTLTQELMTHGMQIELLCLYLPNEHTPTSILFDKMGSLLARLGRLVAQAGAAPADRTD